MTTKQDTARAQLATVEARKAEAGAKVADLRKRVAQALLAGGTPTELQADLAGAQSMLDALVQAEAEGHAAVARAEAAAKAAAVAEKRSRLDQVLGEHRQQLDVATDAVARLAKALGALGPLEGAITQALGNRWSALGPDGHIVVPAVADMRDARQRTHMVNCLLASVMGSAWCYDQRVPGGYYPAEDAQRDAPQILALFDALHASQDAAT
jgi:hypothetical protein